MTFVKKRPPKQEFMVYERKLKDILFDINRWNWNYEINLLNYNSKNGRQWLKPYESLEKWVQEKWRNYFTNKAKLDWKEILHQEQTKKEYGFMWATWHKEVEINDW